VAKVLRVITEATCPPPRTARWHFGEFVQHIWSGNDIKPHCVRTFKLSTDPRFEGKFWDVIGLYINPTNGAGAVLRRAPSMQCRRLAWTDLLPQKAAADRALGSMAEQGLRCVRLRPVNQVRDSRMGLSLPPSLARLLGVGLQPPLLKVGNVDTWRDFLDVRDVCAAYLACVRIGDILADLQILAGTTAEVQIDPVRWRGRDVRSACGDSTQAREVLSWTL
jgi:hypothetical protein